MFVEQKLGGTVNGWLYTDRHKKSHISKKFDFENNTVKQFNVYHDSNQSP